MDQNVNSNKKKKKKIRERFVNFLIYGFSVEIFHFKSRLRNFLENETSFTFFSDCVIC